MGAQCIAMHAGMQGVWINRTSGLWDPFADELGK